MRLPGSTLIPILATLAACGSSRSDAAVDQRPDTTPAAAAAPDATELQSSQGSAVTFYTSAELQRVADELARGTQTGKTMKSDSSYRLIEVRRRTSGVPEVHDEWIDVTLVQAGHASLLTGGPLEGSRVESPGEHRGGNIVNVVTRQIAAGDVFVVSPGVPHQFQLGPRDTIRYLTIKVRPSVSRR